ncbi:MAG TPA: NADH-quinone oxidoreductase subunit NuoF [Candidatus Hydrogenedentes bacterium]|nr:NADH-quinone oxidoreductase subunit NuoF [Candidatus Hydrogenedentota bacterium]
MKIARMHMVMCYGTGCVASGSPAVKAALLAALKKADLSDEVSVIESGCNGFCANGPILVVYPGGIFYHDLKPSDMEELVQEHVLKGRPVERLMFTDPVSNKPVPLVKDIPFFSRQCVRVLSNKGRIAAESIEEYIAYDGYSAYLKALMRMKPEEIIAEVKASGLRGRGGAGFPTAIKWDLCRKSPGDLKYILCNADEGDPGAFMDRSILEADPHALLEGMLIGALAIGASEGYIYCRAEYPLALERLRHAIAECRAMGLIGKNILGTDFSFDFHIAQGSGAFVCGEETALMRSVEGKRGEPRPRPPFPAVAGLWEKPSVLNNVETFANIPLIIRNGSDWYRSKGTEKSPGTKIFAVTGKINNIGLVEVPIGISLGEIVYDIGGGIPNGKAFKAAQIGGPSGGCIPKEHLNVPIDFETLTELGAIMGSGGLIVMDEDTCMVDMARFFLDFVQEESCGKCVPCRIGTKRMLEILDRICAGEGEEGDIEKLITLGEQIKDTSLCGLGQTAPNPVLSTIRHFREEYEIHIREKRCPAGVCSGLVRAPCISACPAGVYVPGFVSLVGEKRYVEALRVHRDKNPFASVCARVCFHACERKCRRADLDDPVAIRGVKRFMVDQEEAIQVPEIRENAVNAKKKVAIIGAGPAGLTCGFFLARLGYKPTIFEAASKPGGMLVQTIPAYRLPRKELEREIDMIQQMGVTVKTNQVLGSDFTLEGLRDEGYEAVFLGVGAPTGTRLSMPNADAEGVDDSLTFLSQYNLTGSAPVGKKVAVIGGGNAAIDAARTALRLGAESVTILYRRTRDEMPAFKEEIDAAESEGVELKTLVLPQEIIAEDGKVVGVRCFNMWLGDFDSSGRRRPQVSEDTEAFIVEADQVIAAIGQKLDSNPLLGSLTVNFAPNGFIAADPLTGQTSVPWLFAGGDAATGPASVVEAVGAGERAAVGIDKFLSGEEHAFWRDEYDVDSDYDPDADPSMEGRAQVEMLAAEERAHSFDEVELAFSESVALREAKRCLRCDYRAPGQTSCK